MDKNMKIGVLIIAIILIVLGINYFSMGDKIKQANINGYLFLEKISDCDITYTINIISRGATPNFDEECFKDAAKNLKGIDFKPGETGEKFILESEEYLGCANINKLKGSEEYRNCIKEILPTLKEKYPEVVDN